MSKIKQPLRCCRILYIEPPNVMCNISSSQPRCAQLTRCFSVVAELLVVCPIHVHGFGQTKFSFDVRFCVTRCVCMCVYVRMCLPALIASKSVHSVMSSVLNL